MKPGREKALIAAIEQGTLGMGSVAGDEYLHNMRQARLAEDGTSQWIEVCFCREPLEEERPYWEEFFELISVKDAHARRNCQDLNGEKPWACCDCDCTKELEARMRAQGCSFLEKLRHDG